MRFFRRLATEPRYRNYVIRNSNRGVLNQGVLNRFLISSATVQQKKRDCQILGSRFVFQNAVFKALRIVSIACNPLPEANLFPMS